MFDMYITKHDFISTNVNALSSKDLIEVYDKRHEYHSGTISKGQLRPTRMDSHVYELAEFFIMDISYVNALSEAGKEIHCSVLNKWLDT